MAAAGFVAGCSLGEPKSANHVHTGDPISPSPVSPYGMHQAGIAAPNPAQPNLLAVVYDVEAGVNVAALVAELGHSIATLATGHDPRLVGLDPGDLTITVGLGPRLIAAIDPALPGAVALDEFPREHISESDRGGDLLLQICATDPLLLPVVAAALAQQMGSRAGVRWSQSGRRGPEVRVNDTLTAPRNVMGFVDGIVGPHTPKAQSDTVWLAGRPGVAGGTIGVYRRMEIDMVRFGALPVERQEAIFGRKRESGAPLSGGSIGTDPNFEAKTADGRYLIPADAHARRANPNAAGVGLMLRRSYTMDNPTAGLLFISFQHELTAFSSTLARMGRSDAMFDFTLTTASASFFVLPGYSDSSPLGDLLFNR